MISFEDSFCYDKALTKTATHWKQKREPLARSVDPQLILKPKPPIDKMICMAANTPLKWREFWFKSLRISDDYLSSVVPKQQTYDVSNKESRQIILAIKKKLKARQKSRQS